jgi:hypothetical protein
VETPDDPDDPKVERGKLLETEIEDCFVSNEGDSGVKGDQWLKEAGADSTEESNVMDKTASCAISKHII